MVISDLEGFVLAGGASRRMGRDKALLSWRGQPMALVVAESLLAVCTKVTLIRRDPEARGWKTSAGAELPVIWGREGEQRHPLWGVAVALESAETDWVMIAPCDVPRIDQTVVRRLYEARGAEGAVAQAEGGVHPLVAVLPRHAAPRARALAEEGGAARQFAALLTRVDCDPFSLANVNRPSDLRDSLE